MKTLAHILILTSATSVTLAQGLLHFSNNSSTLISADGNPMSVSNPFIFALFLSPSTAVNSSGQSVNLTDPAFQIVAAYNTNSSIVSGRLNNRNYLSVGESQGFTAGSTIDFVVRGWSANAGSTWSEALAKWNNGSPLVPMFIGSSQVGNDFLLVGGTVPPDPVFGTGAHQVAGFNMVFVPEPSVLALAALGGAALWVSVLRRK